MTVLLEPQDQNKSWGIEGSTGRGGGGEGFPHNRTDGLAVVHFERGLIPSQGGSCGESAHKARMKRFKNLHF